MLSLIPNMRGLPGFLQKRFDRALYDVHVPLAAEEFAQAHTAAGLEVMAVRYFMSMDLYVLHVDPARRLLGNAVKWSRAALMRGIWAAEIAIGSWPNRFTAPHMICVSRVPRSS